MPISSYNFYPLLRPLLFRIDAEKMHETAVKLLRKRMVPHPPAPNDPVLATTLWGRDFAHPLGLAPGFDKQAELIQEMLDFGFAFTEVGGIAPLPQPGNPRPRLFRLPESNALINRFNFNSDGFDTCLRRVVAWHDATNRQGKRGFVGVNITRGDHAVDDAEAYSLGLRKFAPYVGFVTVNVSCPNEKDARNLEGRDQLAELLRRVKTAHDELPVKPKLLVKISPDQTEQQCADIAAVALESGVDGVIIGNTTATRPAEVMADPTASERGGLSGRPLFSMSTDLLSRFYKATNGAIPLIGTGGIFTGADAYAKIRAGASLLQIYTALIYKGPTVIKTIADELAALLKRDNFASVKDAVGADHR